MTQLKIRMKVSVPWFGPPYPNRRYIFTIPIGCYDAVANSGRKRSNLIFDKLNMIPGKYTVYISKMCILNELDFLLRNKLFFKLQTEKSVSFLLQKYDHALHDYFVWRRGRASLFVYIERFPVEHTALWISVRKNVTKKKEKERKNRKRVILDGLLSQFQVLPVFNPEVSCTTVCWFYITLSICFLSPTTWCTNELRRLELAQTSNSNKNQFDFLSTSHELIWSFLFEFTK